MSVVPADLEKKVVASTSSNLVVAVPSQKKKYKPKVLEEDTYIEKLEKIIERDYFPDIPKLKAQTEYLDAVEKNDVEKIRHLQLRYSTRRTDKRMNSPRSPAYFETPVPAVDNETTKNPDAPDDVETASIAGDTQPCTSKKPSTEPSAEDSNLKNVSIDKLTVDAFVAKFTSEDNASFEDLLDKQEKQHREKYAWMYDAEKEHEKRMQNALALAGADEQLLAITAGPRSSSLQNWSYQSRNSVMFIPDAVEWSVEEMVRRQKMTERVIVHDNTRFKENPFSDEASRQTMSRAAIIHSVVSKGKVDAQGEDVGFKNPMLQYSLLSTPSPAPGVNESPLMTWGEIEGTPFRLDAGDVPIPRTPGVMFKMPEVPLRDKLAIEMTEEIAKRNRDKKQTAVNEVRSNITPTMRRMKSLERLATLSPAAQRLATSRLGIRIGTDKALKASYTPSPARNATSDKSPASSRRSFIPTDTPSPAANKRHADAADESLTSNLLQIKRKPHAADFF